MAPLQTPTTPRIPHDVVKAILDHVYQPSSLSACSLVSRHYTTFAQRRLYHTVNLTTTYQDREQFPLVERFLEFLDSFPRLRTFIRIVFVSSVIYNTIFVTELHSILRKLPALHTLTLMHVTLKANPEDIYMVLDTSPALVEIVDVCAHRGGLIKLIRPFSKPYTLDICNSSCLGSVVHELGGAGAKVPNPPQCLKIKAGKGHIFIADVGATNSLSVDFAGVEFDSDVWHLTHMLSNRCSNLQYLFLGMCQLKMDDREFVVIYTLSIVRHADTEAYSEVSCPRDSLSDAAEARNDFHRAHLHRQSNWPDR